MTFVSAPKEYAVSGSLSSVWLLRANDPVYLRTAFDDDAPEAQRPLRCVCVGERGWLIVADEHRLVFVCRCGRRQSVCGMSLRDVGGLVEAEPVRPHWADLDDALRALGFAPGPASRADGDARPGGRPAVRGASLTTAVRRAFSRRGPAFRRTPGHR